jgi:CubicO group peptidase (beta-lactamase class C family)
MKRVIIYLLIPISALQSSAIASEPKSSNIGNGISEKHLDDFLMGSLHNHGGLQIGIVKNGEIAFLKSYGKGGTKKGANELKNTDFMHTASLTKQFTGWAVAQLIAEGKLKLSDTLEMHLDVPGALKGITIQSLLGHTHGLQSPDALLDVYGTKKRTYNNHDAIELIFNQKKPLALRKGEYGNAGYNLLAEIIAKVSKLKYKEYIKKKILAPANMQGSEIVDDCTKIPKDIVEAMSFDNKFKPIAESYFTCFEGSIGLKSNATELSQWMKYIISQGRKNTDTFKIFSGRISIVRAGGEESDYALGVFIANQTSSPSSDNEQNKTPNPTAKTFAHGGNISGNQHHMVYSPELNHGVVVLSNSTAIDSELISKKVSNYLISRKSEVFNEPRQVCDPAIASYLSGFYPFQNYPHNFNLITDGLCLWNSFPGRMISITESSRSPSLYNAGQGVEFFEVADNGTRKRARRIRLNEKFDLMRPLNIFGSRFPIEPFLGVYQQSENEQLELILESDKLYLKHSAGTDELLWSEDQYLRTTNPVYGAISFVYSRKGEVLGLKYSMNDVQSGFFKKQNKTKLRDLLAISESRQTLIKSKSDLDEQKIENIQLKFFESLEAITDKKSLAKQALEQIETFAKIPEKQVRIALLYSLRGVISQVGNHLLSSDQQQRINTLDNLISKEIRSFDGKITSPTLGYVFFLFHIFPLKGDVDFEAALRSVRDIWKDLDPESQISLAKYLRLWSPLTSERIARNVLSKKTSKRAKSLLNELFAE